MLNQFAIYQLKNSAETRKLVFRTYENLMQQHIAVRVENYDQVYLASAMPGDSPEKIWKRFLEHPPKKFKGYHSISVSDVIVYNKEGVSDAYYIDKERIIPIAGFIRLGSSTSLISMDTADYKVDGKRGNWIATDETIVDGRQFFLMENDVYKKDVPYMVLTQDGKIVTDNSKGFDDETIQMIRQFLTPQERPTQEQAPAKPPLEHYQKYYENGEYVRSGSYEVTEEQNYNMIDGNYNNHSSPKKKKERTSVLAKLHQKQREIAIRSGRPVQEHMMEAPQERNRK